MASNQSGSSFVFKSGITAKKTLLAGSGNAYILENAKPDQALPEFVGATGAGVSSFEVHGQVIAEDAIFGKINSAKVTYTNASYPVPGTDRAQVQTRGGYNAPGMFHQRPGSGAPVGGPVNARPPYETGQGADRAPFHTRQDQNASRVFHTRPGSRAPAGGPVIERISYEAGQESILGVSRLREEECSASVATLAGRPQDTTQLVYHEASPTVPKLAGNRNQARGHDDSERGISNARDKGSHQFGPGHSQLDATKNGEDEIAFDKRMQKPNESVVQYSEELRKLARRHNVSNTADELLRQFIKGLRNPKIRLKLKSRPNLTYDSAVAFAEGMEQASSI